MNETYPIWVGAIALVVLTGLIYLYKNFSEADKRQNYIGKEFNLKVERSDLFDWLGKNPVKVDFVFHTTISLNQLSFNS